jgi:hypothetical protein
MDPRTGNGNGEHVDEHTGEPRSARPDIGNGPTADDTSTSSGDSAHTENRAYTETKDDEITNPPQVGKLDPNGITIDRIFKSTRRFAIYEVGGEVRYQLPNNSTTGRKLCPRIAGLGGLRASIDDLRAELCLSSQEKERAAREMAWALALGFEDDGTTPSEEPKQILTRVDARLRSLVRGHYLKKYVIANLFAFVVIETILISIAVVVEVFKFEQGHWPILHHYAIYGAFGALGAFLSVITGIRSIDVDINLNNWEHGFAGATRISIGVIGALVVALALDSKFIDPTLGLSPPSAEHPAAHPGAGSLHRHVALYLLFAFVGGFSESLVPNLLRKAEQATGGTDAPKASDEPIVKDIKP